MSSPFKVNYNLVTNFLCTILLFNGLWHPFKRSKILQWFYKTYSTILLFIFSIVYTILLVCNLLFITDLDDITARLYISLTEVALVVKVINFVVQNHDWQELLNGFKIFPLKSVHEETYVQGRIRFFQRIMYLYFFFPNCAAQTLALSAYLLPGNNLVFYGWYPGFDWEHNRRDYLIVYLYQHIGIFITCNINVGIDTYYCFTMHMVSAQFGILGKRLQSLKLKNVASRSELLEIIQTHHKIDAAVQSIQKNLLWTYFSQVFLSSIVICSIVKEVASVNKTILYFFERFSKDIID